MTKHVLDRPHDVTNQRLERAIAIERDKLPKDASLALQRRQRTAGQRLGKFAKVARKLNAEQH